MPRHGTSRASACRIADALQEIRGKALVIEGNPGLRLRSAHQSRSPSCDCMTIRRIKGKERSHLKGQLPAEHTVDPRPHKQHFRRKSFRPPSQTLERTGAQRTECLDGDRATN